MDGERPDIRILQRDDVLPLAQRFVQLSDSHVDGVNAQRAALEQYLREAPGGRADVEAHASFRRKSEMVESRGKLHASPRHVGMCGRGAQKCVDRDFRGGLVYDRAVGGHQPRRDRGLRLGATVEQSASDEQAINTFVLRHVGQGRQARMIVASAASLPSASNTLATMPRASSPALAYMAAGVS